MEKTDNGHMCTGCIYKTRVWRGEHKVVRCTKFGISKYEDRRKVCNGKYKEGE